MKNKHFMKLLFIIALALLIAPSVVLAQATAEQQKIVEQISRVKIHFEAEAAILSPASLEKLKDVAAAFRQLPPGSKMEIGSYTDNAEANGRSESYNVRLSEDRSEAVKYELVEMGIDAARLTGKGYGSAQPVADNRTPLGRSQNRRAEFRVTVGSNIETAPATEPAVEPCPSVYVSSSESAALGSNITFSASVSGGDPQVEPAYKWYISDGEIISGQNTSTITVGTKKLKAGTSITATLEVGGYERRCGTSNSGTTELKPN